jgi:hypothetical protein
METPNSTWWERCAALCAIAALLLSLASANMSCGGQDLAFSGQFPTRTIAATVTPTETPLQ